MLTAVTLTLVLLNAPADTGTDPESLSVKAFNVLKTNCYGCHGKDGEDEGGFDFVLDHKKLVAKKKIAPGQPEKSLLLKRMTAVRKPMPPLDDDRVKVRPSLEEVAAVEAWLKAGAPPFPSDRVASNAPVSGRPASPNPAPRDPLLGDRDVFQAIEADLNTVHPDHARYQRYFSLVVQANAGASDAELRLLQAGVSKLLNSLSWRHNPVLPRVRLGGALLAFDLRDLDWDLTGAWGKVLNAYPYGLKFDRYPVQDGFPQLAERVYRATGTDLPVVRADWFLATASQPGPAFRGQAPYRDRTDKTRQPLYETLLNLPDHVRDLEKLLKVDLARNFQRDRLARAGFTKSGVSNQNRIIERHEAAYGAYWISWDFKSDEGRQRIARFPLGPAEIAGPRFAAQSFAHDGGEVIFNLPNGLQAYLLINAKGEAIPEGPPDVVRDKDETAGRNTLIVNGLSCIGCHDHGMKSGFTEEVRDGTAVGGDAGDKVRRLYPERATLERLMRNDEDLFARGMNRACGPYLLVGPDADQNILDFPEPVTSFAKPFLRNKLKLADAARELGLSDPQVLAAAIRTNDDLRTLRTWLVPDGENSRAVWESQQGLVSPFQVAAAVLELGTPLLVRAH